jgi:site-specific DNA recombinase
MKAVIYCRVSTEAQEEHGSSLESQKDACLLKASELGYEVQPEHILLETWTGASLERPLLNQLRELVRSQLVDAVICYSTDRLARNPIHIAIIAEECEKRRVSLCFVSEPLDSSAEGQLIRYVKGYAAQIEREKIRERSLRGKLKWCKEGKLATGGVPPYGYRRENGKRVIFEPEAETVRKMFHWLAYEGYTLYRCAAALNSSAILKRNGSKWINTDIHRIATTPTYKGETYAFRYQAVEPKNPKRELRRYSKTAHVIRPENEWIKIPDATPAIVDETTWALAQSQLRLNSQKSKRNRKREYLLTGRFKCGVCGHAMVGSVKKKGGKEYGFYRCIRKVNPGFYGKCASHLISQMKIEGLVRDKIMAVLSNPELIIAGITEQTSDVPLVIFQADEILLKSQLAQKKEEQDRYVSLYGRGTIPIDILDEKMSKVARSITEIEANIKELEKRKGLTLRSNARSDNAVAFLQNLNKKLNDPEVISLSLEALDIKVILQEDGTVRIVGLLPVSREPGQLVCAKSSHW